MSTIAVIKLTKRQHQLNGNARWIFREDTDRFCSASNSPQNIMELRRKLGETAILMRKVDATDCDGKPINRGKYGLQRLKEIGWCHGH